MPTQPKKAKPAFGRPYYTLVLINALTSISFFTVNPIITKYLTGMGVALALATTIAGLFSLTALTVRPFTGVIADRISPLGILRLGIPLLTFSMVGYSLTRSTPLFVLFRILNGVAFCFNGTTVNAYACKFIPKERIGEGVGYLGLGNVIATAVGPAIGAAVGERFGYPASFLTAAGISLAAFFMLFLLPRDAGPAQAPPAPPPRRKRLSINDVVAVPLFPIAFLGGLFSYSNGTVTNFLSLLTDGKGIANYSVYFTVIGVFLFILRPIAGRLNDRYGLKPLFIPAFLCTAAGLVMIATASSLTAILLAAPLMAFGQGGGQPAAQAYCVKKLGPGRQGVATSTYYICADLFQGTGPIIGGFVVEGAGGNYAAAFYAAAALLVLGLACFLALDRLERKKEGRGG